MPNSFLKVTHIPVATVTRRNGETRRQLDILGSPMNQPRTSLRRAITKHTRITVTYEYKYAPDLIAHDYYGDTNLYWIITRYNGVVHIMDSKHGIVPGRVLLIPDAEQVFQWLQSLVVASQQKSKDGKFVKV